MEISPIDRQWYYTAARMLPIVKDIIHAMARSKRVNYKFNFQANQLVPLLLEAGNVFLSFYQIDLPLSVFTVFTL